MGSRTSISVKRAAPAHRVAKAREKAGAAAQSRVVQATEAKNRFGSIMERIGEAPVVIMKHGVAHAVVIEANAYARLVERAREPHQIELDELRAEFDALFQSMQTRASQEAVDALFEASSEELAGRGVLGTRRRPKRARRPHA